MAKVPVVYRFALRVRGCAYEGLAAMDHVKTTQVMYEAFGQGDVQCVEEVLVRLNGVDGDRQPRRATLRSPLYPETTRRPDSTPLVDLPPEWDPQWDGTVTLQAIELPLFQPVLFGGPAWQTAYVGRRQAVESAFSHLKKTSCDVGARGHFRVFGRIKLTFLMAFEIAAYNLGRVRSAARGKAREPRGRARPKRRQGTYSEILRSQRATERSPGEIHNTGPP